MDTTLQSIIEIALQQGIWAALYVYLFFRMLKENAERETQYQQMINHLSTNVVEGIANITISSMTWRAGWTLDCNKPLMYNDCR